MKGAIEQFVAGLKSDREKGEKDRKKAEKDRKKAEVDRELIKKELKKLNKILSACIPKHLQTQEL
jgi:hypothetical protein